MVSLYFQQLVAIDLLEILAVLKSGSQKPAVLLTGRFTILDGQWQRQWQKETKRVLILLPHLIILIPR